MIARGRVACGCGLTIHRVSGDEIGEQAGVGVPGGKVRHPITSPTPRGTTVKVLSSHSRSPPRPGFVHRALARGGATPWPPARTRSPRARGPGRASHRPGRPSRTVVRWCAGRPLASSKTRACSALEDLEADARTSLGPGVTPVAHAERGPPRSAGPRRWCAGRTTSRSKPYGDRSVATYPCEPGVSSGKAEPSHASNAALPSAAAVSPYTRGDGDSSKAA